MNKFSDYKTRQDGDIVICDDLGIAWQPDTTNGFNYDEYYFKRYVNAENKDQNTSLARDQVNLALKYTPQGDILDIGIGSGLFIKKGYETSFSVKFYGYDINPWGTMWLKNKRIFLDPYMSLPRNISTITYWDSLDHIPNPSTLLDKSLVGTIVLVSVPFVEDLNTIRTVPDLYKPNERYWYFSKQGLNRFMLLHNYSLREESYGKFVFQKYQ